MSVKSIALAALLLLLPASAHAFSGAGNGSSGNPYRITNCAQLSEIDSNLSADYALATNIDCNGSTFNHLASSAAFTGTFDGHNHTIANLNLDNYALFKQTNGATIKNTYIISGSVAGGNHIATFVGTANSTTLSNLHSNATVDASSDPYAGVFIGGLVAEMSGTSSLTNSSYSGTVSGSAYIGGLVGYASGTSTSFSNSYSSGNLNLLGYTFLSFYNNPVYGGGVVGRIASAPASMDKMYSSMVISIATGGQFIGGLIGEADITSISNSFSASSLNTSGPYIGGFAGDFIGSSTNNYFDQTAAGLNSCVGAGSSNCTPVNVGGGAPNYFQNNSANAPLNSWDFDATWAMTTGYPELASLGAFNHASGVPNEDDANGDGIADDTQAYVGSVPNFDDIWSTVELPSDSGCSIDNVAWSNPEEADTGADSQLETMTAFDVYCPTAGATVPITIIYDQQYDTSHSILRHYNPTTHTYSTVGDAVFGTRTVGGVVKTTVTYSLTDGSSLDTDATANGVINDPVGFGTPVAAPSPGQPAVGAPNTGLPKQNSISTIALALIGLAALMAYLHDRRHSN